MKAPNKYLTLSGSLEISSGDLLWLNSEPYLSNSGDIHELTVVAVLYVGRNQGRVLFYSFCIHCDSGIRKEDASWKVKLPGQKFFTTIRENHILRAMKGMKDNVEGISKYKRNKHANMYGRPFITNPSKMANMSFAHMGTRIVDMVDWPRNALHLWAHRLLLLTTSQIGDLALVDDNKEYIVSIVKDYLQRKKPKRTSRDKISEEKHRFSRSGVFKGMSYINFTEREAEGFPTIQSDIPTPNIRPGIIIMIADVPKYVVIDRTEYASFSTIVLKSNNPGRDGTYIEISVIGYSPRSMEWAKRYDYNRVRLQRPTDQEELHYENKVPQSGYDMPGYTRRALWGDNSRPSQSEPSQAVAATNETTELSDSADTSEHVEIAPDNSNSMPVYTFGERDAVYINTDRRYTDALVNPEEETDEDE